MYKATKAKRSTGSATRKSTPLAGTKTATPIGKTIGNSTAGKKFLPKVTKTKRG